MSTWWSNLIEKFSELPAATWYVLGLMVVLGVVLIVMGVKKAPKPAVVAVSALLLAALVAACYLTIPTVSADLESGGVTTASWLYSPAFWSVIVCLVGLVVLVALLRKTQWTVKMLASGALCIALSLFSIASRSISCLRAAELPRRLCCPSCSLHGLMGSSPALPPA